MMNACCYLLRRHLFKKISIHSHSNDKQQHERHDWDTVSSAEKKLNAILEACRHTSESKSTIAANNCISNIEADWETFDDYETMMKRQAWRVLLTLNGEKEPTSLTLDDIASQFNTNCILHEAIELSTDTHLLIQLATRFPILLSQIDGNGRYPLHVACIHGTSKEFIKLCIELNPSAVNTTDIEGNDPIHLLCKGTWKGCWDHHKDDKQTAETVMFVDHNMRSILWMLHNAGTPSSVVFEDEEGVGLIEHAIEAHLSELFIKELQDMIISFNEEKIRKKIANRNRCIEDTRQSKRSRLRQSSSRPFI